MTVKLLTENHLEFLGLTGGCPGSSESTLVEILHCLKSHALAQIIDSWQNIDFEHGGYRFIKMNMKEDILSNQRVNTVVERNHLRT